MMIVGEIRGELSSHIEAVMQDRAEREEDRRASEVYRRDVRHNFSNIATKLQAFESFPARLTSLEAAAGDFKAFRNKLAGAVLVIGFFWALAAGIVKDKLTKLIF